MKIFAVFLFVAVVGAEISQKRQSSLAVLTKLREALPDFIAARDSINHHVSEAKQNASDVLDSFLHKMSTIKMNSLQAILTLEANTLAWGKQFDTWCWENNIPILEGIIGWAGTDFSRCIMQLDISVTNIIGILYADFNKDEADIINNYSLLDAFEKRNIINKPQSIDAAISKIVGDLTKASPEFDSVITNFERYLNGTLPVYSKCLDLSRNKRIEQINLLKKETQRCDDELKPATYPKIVPPRIPK